MAREQSLEPEGGPSKPEGEVHFVQNLATADDNASGRVIAKILERHLGLCRVASQRGADAPLGRYTERTHLGLLSAAAWQCGHEAYEEVSTTKKRSTLPGTGRCDLVLHLGGVPYLVEAKRVRPVIRHVDEVADLMQRKLAKKLGEARDDAKITQKGKWHTRRLSLAFATPRVHPSAEHMTEQIQRAVAECIPEWVSKHRHADFMSAWFPSSEEIEEKLDFFWSGDEYLYTGIALVGGVHVRGTAT